MENLSDFVLCVECGQPILLSSFCARADRGQPLCCDCVEIYLLAEDLQAEAA